MTVRRLILPALLAGLLFAVAPAATACPFCSATGTTLTGEVAQADMIVYGTLSNAKRDPGDPLHSMMQVLTDAGYVGVLGTNCEQTYVRTLRVGEELAVTTRLESVVGPKRTGVGEGYFVTTRNVWRVDGEEVASMMFRVLKFRPERSAEP